MSDNQFVGMNNNNGVGAGGGAGQGPPLPGPHGAVGGRGMYMNNNNHYMVHQYVHGYQQLQPQQQQQQQQQPNLNNNNNFNNLNPQPQQQQQQQRQGLGGTPGLVNNRNLTPIDQLNGGFGCCGEVDHVGTLSEHIGSLYLNEDYTDVTFQIQTSRFHAHKVVLAARSEYFRALLYGGMREASQETIELQDTHVGAFKVLLKYIYTGRITLTNLKEDLVMEILGLAHKYGFSQLEDAVSEYLKAVLNSRNMCSIFGASHLYSLDSLHRFCLDFADKHASDILTTEAFVNLSSVERVFQGAVEQLISRDSFCAPEIEIFRAVESWSKANPDTDQPDVDSILAHIRLPLMKLDELLNTVRPSALLNPDVILDAIKEQNEKRDMEKRYRGFLMPEVNVAMPSQGAQVIEGELKQALLNGDTQNYDMERGFTRHPIEDKTVGIVIELGVPYIVNHIRLLLWDRDTRAYSYFIEVSMDKKDWVRVIDYSNYLCRSWQRLYFKPKVVKFIRVVGTHNTVNRVFHLVALEAIYTEQAFDVDDATGLLKPTDNVATIDSSAIVLEGVSRSRSALLNCDTENYDWDSGYTCHQLGSGAIVVQLPQPYIISSMRLLLWDCDDRSYSYFIEVSTDQQNWKCVADRTKDLCKAWQTLVFDPVATTFVRIVGTHNTANEVFHCVHFECPALLCLQAGAPADRVGSVHTQPSGGAIQSNSSGVVVRNPSAPNMIPRPMVNWVAMNARPSTSRARSSEESSPPGAAAAAGLAQVAEVASSASSYRQQGIYPSTGYPASAHNPQFPAGTSRESSHPSESSASSMDDSNHPCSSSSLKPMPPLPGRLSVTLDEPGPSASGADLDPESDANVPQLPEPEPDYDGHSKQQE